MNQVKSFMLLFMFMKARFKFRILIFMCALGTELSVCAQRNYTLDECIQSALDHNVRMKKARNEVRMAEYDRKEVQSRYLPDISAFGTGFIADQGLAQMELTPELRMSMMKDGVIGGVMATAPLFTGGQIINGDRLAKLGVESKRLQENLSGNEVRLQTEQYFWQVVSLKEKLNTLDAVER
jgi:outer membrane protein